jgi:acyl carrier protein
MGLDSVELVMEFEAEFDIRIPDEAAAKMVSIGDVTDWIHAHLISLGRPRPRPDVFERVCVVTCEQCGTTRAVLTESTEFIRDLGID